MQKIEDTGLKQGVIQKIQDVFSKYPEITEVVLYGSRAKGSYKYNSDIDLTLKGNDLNLTFQQKIELELDDLLLPYKIDLSIFESISNLDLIDHINRVGKIFYSKQK
jgi:predicted nucleotidyltransferase